MMSRVSNNCLGEKHTADDTKSSRTILDEMRLSMR